MTDDATTAAPSRRDELLRQVEEQVAARREELSRLRRADGRPAPEAEPEPAAAPGPPPPGTYAPDLPGPRRRLTLAPKPEAAHPAPPPPAPAPARADAGSAGRLHELADAITTMARRLEELAAELEGEARVAGDVAPASPAPADPASPQPQRRTGPLAEALSATPAPQQTAAAHLKARLVAIEMAVAGASRGDVAERLGREFFGEDAAAILDDVFGSGSVSGARMPWAER